MFFSFAATIFLFAMLTPLLIRWFISSISLYCWALLECWTKRTKVQHKAERGIKPRQTDWAGQQRSKGMKEVNFVKAQRNKVAVGIERAFLYWAHDMTAQSGGVTVNSETDDWPVKHMAGFTLGCPELQLARTKASFLLKSLTSINQSYDSSFSRWHVCQLNAQKTLSLSLLWHLCPFY